MVPGLASVAYFARGLRTYGVRPVLARRRGVWEFQWVLRGTARPEPLVAGGVEGRAPALYLSHPESAHGWTDAGAAASEIFVLHFRAVPRELAARVKPTETLVLNLSESERRSVVARLEEAWEMRRAGDVRLGLKLEQVLVETALLVVGRGAPAAARSSQADRVEQALHWFEENLGERPSVEDVARAVGVSAAHLRRLFAEAGREAPQVELARLRMATAQRCLREGWKLERVAEYLGFSEASAFSRAFSGVCGASPRKWRAREREHHASPREKRSGVSTP
jgi:AraC-like DNA-binding protein